MLPPGLSAHLVEPAERAALRNLHPAGQTFLRLLVGACSCDLVRARLGDSREDERHLRERYRRLGLSRDAILAALETHRQSASPRAEPRGGWPAALAAFVAEHARNAGDTLYYLGFSPRAGLGPPPDADRLRTRTAADVRRRPDEWLAEDHPTLVAAPPRSGHSSP